MSSRYVYSKDKFSRCKISFSKEIRVYTTTIQKYESGLWFNIIGYYMTIEVDPDTIEERVCSYGIFGSHKVVKDSYQVITEAGDLLDKYLKALNSDEGMEIVTGGKE